MRATLIRMDAVAPGTAAFPGGRVAMFTKAFGTAAVLVLTALMALSGRIGAPTSVPPGGDVNQRNTDGSTPLQWAVYNGDAVEVRRLLAAGADVSIVNDYG